MQDIVFDHIFSPCRNNDIPSTLKVFEKMGFRPKSEIIKHSFGNHSGCAVFTGTYMEFLSFYDSRKWNAELDSEVDEVLRAFRPYGIGIRCENSFEIYERFKKVFPESKPTFSASPQDVKENAPVWTFFEFPKGVFPGASCFSVQYLRLLSEESRLQIKNGQNTISFMNGFTFCSDDPKEYFEKWKQNLGMFTEVHENGENTLQVGIQTLEWISPLEYEHRFRRPWLSVNSIFGAVAAVKVQCDDMQIVQNYLQGALLDDTLFVPPEPIAGYAFEVRVGNSQDTLAKLRQNRSYLFQE